MKSGKPGVDHSAARAFAFENGWVGAGWGLDASPHEMSICNGSTDLDAYEACAVEVFAGDASLRRALSAIGSAMAVGDYCWSYDSHKGEYWCCKVIGDFQYHQGGPFDQYDLHMLRPCRWAKVGTAESVPGAIRRAFAGPFGTVTALSSDKNRIINAAKLALGEPGQKIFGDLFDAAGPEDLEDLIALYLQSEGWLLLPSTAKVSMASYEFVMVHKETGLRAGVQVKSGGVKQLRQQVADDFDEFFVFLAGKNPTVLGDDRVRLIEREDVRVFAERHRSLLPARLRAVWPPAR